MASLTFFPDAIVSRKVTPTLELLRDHGLEPLAAARISLDRDYMAVMRAYERKPINIQPILMREIIESSGPALFVILESSSARQDMAAWLNQAKGSSFPWDRRSHHLRTRLGATHPMLKIFHTPDDFDELCREVGLLRRLRRTELEGATFDVTRTIARMEADYPRHDLDFDAARMRLVQSLGTDAIGQRLLEEAKLDRQRPRLQTGDPFRWEEIYEHVIQNRPDIDEWDLITVCAHLTLVLE